MYFLGRGLPSASKNLSLLMRRIPDGSEEPCLLGFSLFPFGDGRLAFSANTSMSFMLGFGDASLETDPPGSVDRNTPMGASRSHLTCSE